MLLEGSPYFPALGGECGVKIGRGMWVMWALIRIKKHGCSQYLEKNKLQYISDVERGRHLFSFDSGSWDFW